MVTVKVSNLFSLLADYTSFQPTHFLSILNPDIDLTKLPTLKGSAQSLYSFFYDDDDREKANPLATVVPHLKTIILFLDRCIRCKGHKRLLMHCHAGASRSPAVAFIFYAMYLGKGKEDQAFAELLKITNKPWPSYSLVSKADKLLGCEGRLLKPLNVYRKQHPFRYDAYLYLNKKRKLNQFDKIK